MPTNTTHANAELRKRLSDIPQHYLSALAGEDDALVEFDQLWEALAVEVRSGIQAGWLQDDVAQLAYNSATLIATYADSLVACEKSAASTIADVNDALARLTLSEAKEPPPNEIAYADHSYQLPAYIPEAYGWLRENTHNPYPTSQVSQIIACQSGLRLREVHEWFKVIRRVIGWVDLCKKHFRGSRALAIEAASQVLLEQKSSHSIPVEIQLDLLSLWGRVECLYPMHGSTNTRDFPIYRHPTTSQLYSSTTFRVHDAPKPAIPPKCLRTQASPSELPNCTPSRSSRKRRFSDAGNDEARKKRRVFPGETRRQVVSDPLPCPSTSEREDLDILWADLFNPVVSSLTTDADSTLPMSVVPNTMDPPASEDQMIALSNFWACLKPEYEQLSVPFASVPDYPVWQDDIQCLPLIDSQSLDNVLPFADPSLAMDPADLCLSTREQNLELSLKNASLETLFGFSEGSHDNSSDTSSILTLSPPRTPATPSSPSLLFSSMEQPPKSHWNVNGDGGSTSHSVLSEPQQSELVTILEELLRERTLENNSTPLTFPLGDSFSLFNSSLPLASRDSSNFDPLLTV